MRAVKAKGAALKATEQPIDTSRQSVLGYVGSVRSFAEFETNLRKERQGIAKAKPAGVYKGRLTTIEAAEVAVLHAEDLGATEIARRLGIGRASVYRALG